MKIFLCVISGLCLASGTWISALNWVVFWKRHVLCLEAPSWIPLLGGGLVFTGLVVLPLKESPGWSWIPLFADWGCVPGIGYSLYCLLARNKIK
jgi:hypothetical protein